MMEATMRSRRYVILHDRWGALRWSDLDDRLIAASHRYAHEHAKGMRAATTYRTVGAARRAVARTVDYWERLSCTQTAGELACAKIVAVEVAR
jgi:hypothetical protein